MSAPRGATAALASLLTCLVALTAVAAPGYAAGPAPWPASASAVLSEVVTAGATASDEFVEVYNAAPVAIELTGCELVYVSASGSSVTRKVALDGPLSLAPGQRLLLANAAGAYASTADATYSGGLAGEGGTLVLRRADGSVIDALSWGAALNAYAEGGLASAPGAGESLERRPGSPHGNWLDTNDNTADWLIQRSPNPQGLAAAAEPAPAAPTAEPSDEPTGGPSEAASSDPSAAPTTAATTAATPGPTTSLEPASPEPSVSPDPSGSNDVESIALARQRQPGASVHVAGTVTISPGLMGSDLLFAMSDPTAGIFVRLPSAAGLRAGQPVEAVGTLAAPYGQLEIRQLEMLSLGPQGEAPTPTPVNLADVGEELEGSLVTLEGRIESVQGDDGRLALQIADGEHSLRVLADPRTGIFKADVSRGQRVRVTGIVGQHASATGNLDGYKLWLRSRDDLAVLSVDPDETAERPDVQPSVRPVSNPKPVPVDAAVPGSGDRLTPVADLPDLVGQKVTVAGLITSVYGGGAILDDGTGRLRLGGDAAVDAIGLLQPGDAVEVNGTVTLDAGGLLLFVDPERIVAVPGAGLPASHGSAVASGAPEAPSAPAHASPATDPAASLIRPRPWPGLDLDPAAIPLGIVLALAAALAVTGLAALAVPGIRVRLTEGLDRASRRAITLLPLARRSIILGVDRLSHHRSRAPRLEAKAQGEGRQRPVGKM